MNETYTEDTFCGTGIPCTAMAKSFRGGSPAQLLEKALEVLDPITVEVIRSIETIKQAEKVYKRTKNREEMNAILVKWIILCENSEELSDALVRSPSQSLPEAAALQRTMGFKLNLLL